MSDKNPDDIMFHAFHQINILTISSSEAVAIPPRFITRQSVCGHAWSWSKLGQASGDFAVFFVSQIVIQGGAPYLAKLVYKYYN